MLHYLNKLKDWQKLLLAVCIIILLIALFKKYHQEESFIDNTENMNHEDDEENGDDIENDNMNHDDMENDNMNHDDMENDNMNHDDMENDNMNHDDMENFSDFSGNKPCFTLFYAPWCGHCKTTMPSWDELIKKNNTTVVINKVNCDENEDLAQLHNIQGYPTIKYLPNGLNSNEGVEFNGERTVPGFLSFLNEHSR